MKRTILLLLIIVLSMAVGIIYSCSNPKESSTAAPTFKASDPRFVGDETCATCHSEQAALWKGSHHDYAMRRANEQSVRADFNNTTFTHNGNTYRFFRQDSLFMVEAPGPDGQQKKYQITHTFGWTPLQQYLVDFGKGKLQVLNIAWNTRKEQWYAMNPEQDIRHGDWLHWTGAAMNWNSMCADCHSTNLQKNYIPEADSFNTTWSSINVSCEACHGPGKKHVEFVRSTEGNEASIERIREDLELTENSSQKAQITKCAQCHSLREEIAPGYAHKGNFLDFFSPTLPHPDAYFPDGQIKEEVYVYGSFLQSKMYHSEGVKCNDCHDPHSLKLKANVVDNSLCMQCHDSRYNSREHFKHPVNTEASQCVSCHMPGRTYMEINFRRDHSFRAPRPDLSVKYGTPNACNSCHGDKSAQWAADAVKRWYGPDRPDHFSEVLARADSVGAQSAPQLKALVSDSSQPDIARATAIWYLGQFAARESIDLLRKTIHDESALVRSSSVRALSKLPDDLKLPVLQEALDDSVRAVRVAAAGGLAEFSAGDIAFGQKQHFKKALEEYKNYLNLNRYFPQGQMNRGQFFEKRGKPKKAIQAYKKALEKDPQFNPARINLAYLYNSRGNKEAAKRLLKKVIEQEPNYGPAYYSLGLLVAEQNKLELAANYFSQAAELMPQNARLYYNWAISLQRLNKPEEAQKAYKQAIKVDPENPDYRYGIVTLLMQQGQYQKALTHAQKLKELLPNNRRINSLLQRIKRNID